MINQKSPATFRLCSCSSFDLFVSLWSCVQHCLYRLYYSGWDGGKLNRRIRLAIGDVSWWAGVMLGFITWIGLCAGAKPLMALAHFNPCWWLSGSLLFPLCDASARTISCSFLCFVNVQTVKTKRRFCFYFFEQKKKNVSNMKPNLCWAVWFVAESLFTPFISKQTKTKDDTPSEMKNLRWVWFWWIMNQVLSRVKLYFNWIIMLIHIYSLFSCQPPNAT